MPQSPARDPVAEALKFVLVSPNEADRNFEPANVVDGLYAIARGLRDVADALRCPKGHENEEARP